MSVDNKLPGEAGIQQEKLSEVLEDSDRLKGQLRESEERLRLALDAAQMGIWDWDLETGELHWSDYLQNLFGFEPGTFPGTFEAFIARVYPEDQNLIRQFAGLLVEGEQDFDQEYRILLPDGTVRYIAGKGRLYRNTGGQPKRVVGTAVDVTERKKSEERRQFMIEANNLLTSTLDYETILRNLARLVVPRLADWCTIDMESDRTPGKLEAFTLVHSNPVREKRVFEIKTAFMPQQDETNPITNVFLTGAPVLVPRIPLEMIEAVTEDENLRSLLRELNLISALYVPIMGRGRIFGVLTLNTDGGSGRVLGQAELELAQELASRAAVAVENARLYRFAQEARIMAEKAAERTRRLQAVTAALSGATTREEVSRTVFGEGLDATQASAGTLITLKEDKHTLEVVGVNDSVDRIKEWFPHVTLDDQLPAPEAVRSGQPIWMEDLNEPEWAERYPVMVRARDELGRKSYAFLPFNAGQPARGAVVIGYEEPHRFELEERKFLMALAQQCGQALERARLYELETQTRLEAEAARRRLSFLAEVSAALSASLDYNEGLQQLAHLAVPTLADYCIVDLWDEQKGQFVRPAVAHFNPAREQLMREVQRLYPPDPNSDTGINMVFKTGKTVFAPEVNLNSLPAVSRNEEHLKILSELAPCSSIIIPLRARGRTFGVLSLATSEESKRRYTPSDLELAEELARRAAITIDNARLYQEARAAIEDRDEFLSVAAHELKTPLTGLQGFIQLLERQLARTGSIDPQRLSRGLEVINRQSHKLGYLISHLLDVSRIEAGRLALQRTPTDLKILVEGVISTIQASALRHSLVFSSPLRLEALVDPLRFEQVVTNLLDNAIKYSPEGGPVEIELSKTPDNLVCLSVIDHGIGIPRERRSNIFDRFYQAHDKTHSQGMGLGLYISNQIVELHGGKISVEFPESGGSHFQVQIPA